MTREDRLQVETCWNGRPERERLGHLKSSLSLSSGVPVGVQVPQRHIHENLGTQNHPTPCDSWYNRLIGPCRYQLSPRLRSEQVTERPGDSRHLEHHRDRPRTLTRRKDPLSLSRRVWTVLAPCEDGVPLPGSSWKMVPCLEARSCGVVQPGHPDWRVRVPIRWCSGSVESVFHSVGSGFGCRRMWGWVLLKGSALTGYPNKTVGDDGQRSRSL